MKKYFSVGFALMVILFYSTVVNNARASVLPAYNATIDSDPQTINVGTLSSPMELHVEPVAGQTLHFTLSSNSTSGNYYFTNASCTSPLSGNTIYVSTGDQNKHFCYYDTTPGVHTITAINVEELSTAASQEITVVGPEELDTVAPIVTLDTPTQDSVIKNSEVPYSFNFTDNLDESINCALYLNGQFAGNAQATNGVEYNAVYERMTEGLNSLFVSCTDAAGNTGTSNENSFTVDLPSTPTQVEKRSSTISGGKYIPREEPTEIPGCGERVDGYSTINGKSCRNNIPHEDGWVLGAEKFNFTLFLKMGHPPYPTGAYMNEVMELQKFLNAAPYNSGLVVDGKFGPLTNAAVIKLQLANGLVGDGVVGPLTRAILNK